MLNPKNILKNPIKNTNLDVNSILKIEIDNLLKQKDEGSLDVISLYDVEMLIKNKMFKYFAILDAYEKYMSKIIKSNTAYNDIILYEPNYQDKEITLSFKKDDNTYEKIIFSKDNNNLFIKESNCKSDQKIFALLQPKMISLFDELDNYSKVVTQSKYKVESTNTSFFVKMNRHGIELSTKYNNLLCFNDIELLCYLYKDFDIEEAENSIELKKYAANIYKKIFIKIDDCLDWAKPYLYEMRKRQLYQEEIFQYEEEVAKQNRKRRRLEKNRRNISFFRNSRR